MQKGQKGQRGSHQALQGWCGKGVCLHEVVSGLERLGQKKGWKWKKDFKEKVERLAKRIKGPPLFSGTARQAERKRLGKLRQNFNKADARWSKIRQEANIKYLGWSNSKLEKMFKEAKVDLVHQDFTQIELKDSIAETEGTIGNSWISQDRKRKYSKWIRKSTTIK